MRKRDEKILQKLVSRFDKGWQKQAEKAVKCLYEQIGNGVSVTKAVDNLQKEYSELFKLDGLQDMMTEAACYGYGIMPTVLTRGQGKAWGKDLAKAWDASGMTLSEKIHGAGVKMRGEIIRTLQTQMRNNQGWMKAARALYDGYSKGKNAWTGGKDIIRQQKIPQYIRKVLIATNDSKMAVAQRQALDNINRLARNGAPNKALKTAYIELLESVQKGNDEAVQKAIQTAINEKSRYVAERIARTEMARAYADGFIAKMNQDADVVAVKFKLSGRHPTFDICDMYAKADMYNLGVGVYPKDKLPPLPVHPHCLCRYSEVYIGEVDTTKEKPRIREAGDKWLEGLTEYQRQKVLGVDGLKAWKAGKDWRKYMHGYAGFEGAKSRLTEPVQVPLQAKNENGEREEGAGRKYDDRNTVASPDIKTSAYRRKFNNLGEDKKIERVIYNQACEILNHRSGTIHEDLVFIDTITGKIIAERECNLDGTVKCPQRMLDWIAARSPQTVVGIHNHPHSTFPSREDVDLSNVRGYKYGVIACHNGRVIKYTIVSRFNIDIIDLLLDRAQNALYHNNKEELQRLLKQAEEEGVRVEVW